MAFRTLTTQEVINEFGCHYDVLMNEQRLGWGEDNNGEYGIAFTLEDLREAQEKALADAQERIHSDPQYQRALRVQRQLQNFLNGPWPFAHLTGLRFTANRERARNAYLPNVEKYINHKEQAARDWEDRLASGPKMIPGNLKVTLPEVGDKVWQTRVLYANEIDLVERTVTKVLPVFYYGFLGRNDKPEIEVIVYLDGERETVSWQGQLDSNKIDVERSGVGNSYFVTREAAQEHLEHYLNNLEAKISELREKLNS